MDPLRQWLHVTNKFIKKDQDLESTHYMLNGGKFFIPMPEYPVFLKLYSKYVREYKYYIVEKKTPNFVFFSDLDFIDSETVPIEDIIRTIQGSILFFYEQDYKCIVCSSDNKTVVKNGKEYIKQGFHLHWPEIIIDSINAKKLRKSIVTKLNTLYGKRESSYNNWNDIVDSCVYDKNGLRMCGSHKGMYSDNEWNHEGRAYWPLFVMDTAGSLDKKCLDNLNSDIFLTINECSIRSDSNTLSIIKNIPVCDLGEDCESDEDTSTSSSNYTKLSIISLEYKEILTFFKNHVMDYRVDDIKRIFNYGGNVYVITTKSRFCQNISRKHNSCGVYFKLTASGICQKCFCKCDTQEGRKYGYCKDFSSSIIPCTQYLLKVLGWESKARFIKNSNAPIKNDTSIDSLRDLLYNQFTNKSPFREKNKQRAKPKPKH